MIGRILVTTHRTFYAIGQWFAAAEDHPAYRAIQSRRAYARFQAEVRAEKAAVRAKHGRVREIERRQTQTIHAALAANRNHGA